MVSVLCLGMATMGWSYTIVGGSYDGTNVGNVDTFLASTDSLSNSNPTTEEDWANTILNPGDTATFVFKDEEDIPYYGTDTTGVYAFNIVTLGIDYFLIKNATYWALFGNKAENDWGVFDTSFLPNGMNLPSSDYTISHVTQFTGENGTPDPIPEPATVLLLGLGLVGLATFGRKKLMN